MHSASEPVIPASDSDKSIHWAILLGLPWLLFVLNPNWTFQGFGNMDPFYYFGHFIHFPHQQRLLPTYAGERLPWLLPGYALVHLLTPVYGTMALHFLAYYVCVFSLYSIVRRFADTRSALLTTCTMGCHPYFIAAHGTDYVNGGCLAYCLLAFALLVRSGTAASPSRWVFAAGMSWAAVVYTYLFWIVLTPACLLLYLAVDESSGSAHGAWRERLQRISLRAAAFAGGVLALTLVLVIAHGLIFGGTGLEFQRSSINAAIGLSQMSSNPYVTGKFSLSFADWLVFPGLTGLLSVMLLLPPLRRRLQLRAGTSKLLLAYFYFFTVMVIMTVRTTRMLEFDYFAAILLPAMFVVLGVTIFLVPVPTANPRFWFVLLLTCSISLAPLGVPGLYKRPPVLAAALPGLLVSGGIALRFLRPKSVFGWSAGMLALAAAGFCMIPRLGGLAWQMPANWMNVTRRVGEAVQTINNRMPADKYPAFWYNEAERGEYQTIMVSFLSHGNSMGHFPALEVGRKYNPGQVLVLLNGRKGVFAPAARIMERAGMPLSLLWEQKITTPDVSYWITATEVQPPGEPTVSKSLPQPVSPGEFELDGVKEPGHTFGLERWVPSYTPTEMTARMARDGLYITTAKPQFAYAVMYPLLTTLSDGLYEFRLTYRVAQGELAFGALSADLSNWIGQAGPPESHGANLVRTFALLLNRGDTFRLAISNNRPGSDQPSSFVLEELNVFRE